MILLDKKFRTESTAWKTGSLDVVVFIGVLRASILIARRYCSDGRIKFQGHPILILICSEINSFFAMANRTNQTYHVPISLGPDKLKQFYAGQVRSVWARDVRGVSLQFPLEVLRPYISHLGVQGHFELVVNGQGKLVRIRQKDV